MSNTSTSFGIDTNRIYFREEICEMWGYEVDRVGNDPTEADRLRKWFKRHFTSKGLNAFPTGRRVAVHGTILSEWIRYNSKPIADE